MTLRIRLAFSARKAPKPAPEPTGNVQPDSPKQAEIDALDSLKANQTILTVKSYFVAERKATYKVLCLRDHAIDVTKPLPADVQGVPGHHFQTPVSVKDFSRELLSAVNHIESQARAADHLDHNQKDGLIDAAEAVRVLMNYSNSAQGPKGSFIDTPQLRAAVDTLWQRQRILV